MAPIDWATSQPNLLLDAVVAVRDLDHSFGHEDNRKQVLTGVTIELHPGEVVIMTGPSGSGKTTLLTLIGALRSAQNGSVCVLGRELCGLPPRALAEVRRDIGFIFQAHNLFTALTALQNVRMALELKQPPGEELDALATTMLREVGLEHRLHHRPAQLSGGQKQRVAIARALVNRPRLVLADEPTAALDKESGRQVIELFRRLVREQLCTILLVTHDNRILDAADRIVNMVDGQIVSDVVVKEAVQVAEFLARCPLFAGHSPHALTEIGGKMRRERYAAGAAVITRGEIGDKFYVLRKGTVEVLDSSDVRMDEMGEGNFFGESALLTGNPRNATIRAISPVEVYSLSKQDFLAALESLQSLREQLLQVLFLRQG